MDDVQCEYFSCPCEVFSQLIEYRFYLPWVMFGGDGDLSERHSSDSSIVADDRELSAPGKMDGCTGELHIDNLF